jgi:hypothetical protein
MDYNDAVTISIRPVRNLPFHIWQNHKHSCKTKPVSSAARTVPLKSLDSGYLRIKSLIREVVVCGKVELKRRRVEKSTRRFVMQVKKFAEV